MEEQVDDELDRQFVWGQMGVDNLILRDRPGDSERFYACAGTISVTAILNASGEVEERYGYDAYGFVNFMNPSFGSIGSSAYAWETLYNSYRYDGETGLYLVRNRFFHPTLGIWMSLDPAGYKGGLNLYAYCGNAPINCTDPLGLLTFWGAVGAVSAVVGVVAVVAAAVTVGPVAALAAAGAIVVAAGAGEVASGIIEGGPAAADAINKMNNPVSNDGTMGSPTFAEAWPAIANDTTTLGTIPPLTTGHVPPRAMDPTDPLDVSKGLIEGAQGVAEACQQ
jgi:RHS repeat-associated protein